jgi:hypothetical protein
MISKDLSPSEETFPLPSERQSDGLRKALAEVGARSEFRDGVEPLRTLGIETSFKTIERVSERVGPRSSRRGRRRPRTSPRRRRGASCGSTFSRSRDTGST